jgi:CxxC-x17-CxxC domain-containing protein
VLVFEDRTLVCRDCSDSFIFSGGEQRFFAEKGLTNVPQRCPSCRANAKRVRMGGPKEYHAAVCNACGDQAMVPFAPRTDRPVYCSTCFDKVRAGLIQPAAAPVPTA